MELLAEVEAVGGQVGQVRQSFSPQPINKGDEIFCDYHFNADTMCLYNFNKKCIKKKSGFQEYISAKE
jgi:hypothetical protein